MFFITLRKWSELVVLVLQYVSFSYLGHGIASRIVLSLLFRGQFFGQGVELLKPRPFQGKQTTVGAPLPKHVPEGNTKAKMTFTGM